MRQVGGDVPPGQSCRTLGGPAAATHGLTAVLGSTVLVAEARILPRSDVAADAVCGEMCRGFALQQLKDALFNLRAKRAAAVAAAAADMPVEPAAPPASHA